MTPEGLRTHISLEPQIKGNDVQIGYRGPRGIWSLTI